jgi:CubicO group peptidase (beta-lactamase class C family)
MRHLVLLLILMTPLGYGQDSRPSSRPAEPSKSPAAEPVPTPSPQVTGRTIELARRFSESRRGRTLLVMQKGEIIGEHYARRMKADRALELASGTKSVTGVIALLAVEDGLITLDEKVSDSFPEWKRDPRRAGVTLRHLLTLTSGLRARTTARQTPGYVAALETPMVARPGQRFRYGAQPFQIFGAVLSKKLAAREKPESFEDYAFRRLFAPLGIERPRWKRTADGNVRLSSGLALRARDWARFGRCILDDGKHGQDQILPASLLPALFQGSRANPGYGLTWWLPRQAKNAKKSTASPLPADLVMAAGAGNQRLFLIPSLDLVVVRQAGSIGLSRLGNRPSWSDEEFLSLLLYGRRHDGRKPSLDWLEAR